MSELDRVINRKNTYSIKWDGIGLNYENPDLIPLSIADMDWQAPKEVVDAVISQARVGIYGYPMPAECYSSLIIRWLKEQNDWDISEEEIGYAVRVVDILSLAVCALTEEGDSVMVHTPLYCFFKTAVGNARRKLIANQLKRTECGYVIDFDAFEQQVVEQNVKMFICCNPHNPTGRVWTEPELEQMVDICAAHGVVIVSDEIHSDLTLPGYRYTPLAKVARSRGYNEVITTKSASKSFNLAGLQLGYYLSQNPRIMSAIAEEKKYRTYPDLPNNFSIAAMKAAYEHGLPWLEEVRHYIQQNYFCLRSLIEERFPSAYLAELQGTYLTWLDVSYLDTSEQKLKETLDLCGVGGETTSDFGITEGLFIRMNIACPRTTLDQALVNLSEALTRLSKRS